MAHQGLDPTFGLKGTCTSHVSGFGGWPLAVVVGIDGRPTLACSAPDQLLADQRLTPGGRLRAAPMDTPRVVSFPPDGEPFGRGSRATASYGRDPDDWFLLGRAIAHSDRIAVLGDLIHGNRRTLTLQTFHAEPPRNGISTWTARPRTQPPGVASSDPCALGWLRDQAVVVAPQQFTGSALQLLVYVEPGSKAVVTVPVAPSRLALTAGFQVEPWVTAVSADRSRALLVAISWIALDPAKGRFRVVGSIDESRASVLRLRRTSNGWTPDIAFGVDGLWVAAPKDGEITTADHVAVTTKTVTCVGQATRGGARSLFAASLDLQKGHLRWTTHPGPDVLDSPTGIAVDTAGRVFACGSTRPFDSNYPRDDPAEAAIVSLLPTGKLDPAFGVNGVARFRLNGATYARGVAVTPTGHLLVASVMRWGGQGAGLFHPCVTRLLADGEVDGTFGLAGVCRHDGLGDAQLAAVDQTGRVWTAGVGSAFTGMVPGFRPWSPPKTTWLQYLTLSRLARDGGLEHGFGLDGTADHQLRAYEPSMEHFSVDSLVLLASGGAVVSGDYGSLVVDQLTGDTMYETAGTWVAGLTTTGGLDASFGNSGVKRYPSQWFQLATELANGQLQGWEADVPLRLEADGSAAAGFGSSGAKPVYKPLVTLPVDYEPDGEWFAPVYDTQSTIGLVRCAPDGTIDPNFGAGGATRQPAALVDVTKIQTPPTLPAVNPEWENQGGPHRTLRLSDGTYLTLWTVTWQETVNVPSIHNMGGSFLWRTAGLVLIAWTATGTPRSVAQWGGKSVKAIPNPLRAASPWNNWLGWQYRCALLQSDDSIIVGLQGDDGGAKPDDLRPAFIRTSSYFVHLVPPAFDPSASFGGGHIVRRLPGEDHQIPGDDPRIPGPLLVDYQCPTGLQAVGTDGTVVAAITSQTVTDFIARLSPDLLADGSAGMMRLV